MKNKQLDNKVAVSRSVSSDLFGVFLPARKNMETQIKQKYVDVKHWSYHGEFNHADYHGARILPVAQAHELIDEINQADNGLWQATLVWLTESEFVALPLTDKKGNRAK